MPLVLPLLLLPFGRNVVSVVFSLSLLYGGVPYLPFAVVLFVLIGRLGSSASIQRLSYFAPFLFIPVQAVGCTMYEAVFKWLHPESAESAGWLSMFMLFSFALGYVYVALANIGFLIARRVGWVSEPNAWPLTSRSTGRRPAALVVASVTSAPVTLHVGRQK